MSSVQTIDEIYYPESDGMPIGETDVHRDWMIRILDMLRWRYRDQRVYVASDLVVYYHEGDPSKYVVPDDFVVKDCDPSPRRTYLVWKEGKAPDVVFEVTSRSSRDEDRMYKPRIYARMGVKECFLYDPTSEYLHPALQGFRLEGGEYTRIEPDETGALMCEELDLVLRLGEKGRLVLCDRATGQVLSTAAQAERRAREAAEAAREAERRAREAAEARAAELEAEVQRLREELEIKRGEDQSSQ